MKIQWQQYAADVRSQVKLYVVVTHILPLVTKCEFLHVIDIFVVAVYV